MSRATKIDKLQKRLASTALSAKQIRSRFNIPNPSAVINDLRNRGLTIRNRDGMYTMSAASARKAMRG